MLIYRQSAGQLGSLAWVQTKLVRRAIEEALAAVKRANPLELLSLFEQRMSCLGHIARCALTATLRA